MNNFIHDFVHTLSLSEKAYFKKFASFHHGNKDKNYLRLYELLMKHGVFDEKKLAPSLNKIGLAKHYSSEQNYLYRQLMTSLINFHFENTTYRKLTKQILAIDLLMEKGFRKKANKILRKAKKLATDLEEFSILLKLIQLEEEILFREGILNFTKKLQELKQERQRVMLIIENYSDLRLLREQIRELQYTVHYYREFDQYLELLNPPIMEDVSNALSVKALSHWYYIKMSIANMKGEMIESLQAGKDTLVLIERYPALFPSLQRAVTLSNILFDTVIVNDRLTFDKTMIQLKSQTDVDKYYITYVEYVRKLKFGITNYQLDLLKETIPPANDFMFSQYHLIETAQRNNLFLVLTSGWMVLREFTKAVELLNHWEQVSTKNLYLSFRRMARLIIYYELEWHNLLESEVQSTYKILKKYGVYEKREQVLLAFFRNVIKKPTRQKQARKQLCEKLAAIESNPDLRLFYPYFDYLSWANTNAV